MPAKLKFLCALYRGVSANTKKLEKPIDLIGKIMLTKNVNWMSANVPFFKKIFSRFADTLLTS